MSPEMKTRRDGTKRPARYGSVQPMVVLWLSVVWLAMWGAITPLLVVGGILVAIIVCLVFPLPPIRMAVRIRPVALTALIGRFLIDVVRASLQVSRIVLRPRKDLSNAVVAVHLNTPSDFVLTVVALMLSLVPGSVVVEARRSTHTLFLHVIDVKDLAEVEAFRASALALEERVLKAVAPRDPDAFLAPEEGAR